MWARRVARVMAARARDPRRLDRGYRPGSRSGGPGPWRVARGEIAAAARGFNAEGPDGDGRTGAQRGASETRGAGRRDADPRCSGSEPRTRPRERGHPPRTSARAPRAPNRGGPGGTGAPNPFVRRGPSKRPGAERGEPAIARPVGSERTGRRPGEPRGPAAPAEAAPEADDAAAAAAGDEDPAPPPPQTPPQTPPPPPPQTRTPPTPDRSPIALRDVLLREGHRAHVLHPRAAPHRVPHVRGRIHRGAIAGGARRRRRLRLSVDVPPRDVRVDRGSVHRGRAPVVRRRAVERRRERREVVRGVRRRIGRDVGTGMSRRGSGIGDARRVQP